MRKRTFGKLWALLGFSIIRMATILNFYFTSISVFKFLGEMSENVMFRYYLSYLRGIFLRAHSFSFRCHYFQTYKLITTCLQRKQHTYIHATHHAHQFRRITLLPLFNRSVGGCFHKTGIFFRDVTARVYWHENLFQSERSVEGGGLCLRTGSSGDLG
jgi:hypothetical protein